MAYDDYVRGGRVDMGAYDAYREHMTRFMEQLRQWRQQLPALRENLQRARLSGDPAALNTARTELRNYKMEHPNLTGRMTNMGLMNTSMIPMSQPAPQVVEQQPQQKTYVEGGGGQLPAHTLAAVASLPFPKGLQDKAIQMLSTKYAQQQGG